jgi:hypothetical protein
MTAACRSSERFQTKPHDDVHSVLVIISVHWTRIVEERDMLDFAERSFWPKFTVTRHRISFDYF